MSQNLQERKRVSPCLQGKGHRLAAQAMGLEDRGDEGNGHHAFFQSAFWFSIPFHAINQVPDGPQMQTADEVATNSIGSEAVESENSERESPPLVEVDRMGPYHSSEHALRFCQHIHWSNHTQYGKRKKLTSSMVRTCTGAVL